MSEHLDTYIFLPARGINEIILLHYRCITHPDLSFITCDPHLWAFDPFCHLYHPYSNETSHRKIKLLCEVLSNSGDREPSVNFVSTCNFSALSNTEPGFGYWAPCKRLSLRSLWSTSTIHTRILAYRCNVLRSANLNTGTVTKKTPERAASREISFATLFALYHNTSAKSNRESDKKIRWKFFLPFFKRKIQSLSFVLPRKLGYKPLRIQLHRT